ncbi:MAG: ABC transporter permease [Caldilineae bacterium]|nr:ABC transporter permease [Caldilineae bacterium]
MHPPAEPSTVEPPLAGLWQAAWPPLALLAGLVLAWHLVVVVGGLPAFILPSPGRVLGVLVARRAGLGEALLASLAATFAGLGLALVLGLTLALLIQVSTGLRRALYPLLVVSQTVQILAIAPLLVIWMGFGMRPTIAIVVLICFFPLAVSTADGLAAVDPELVALLESMGASRSQVWRMVRLPAALPAFFSGLKIAVTYSVVGATIGEWVGGSTGLGLYLLRSKNALATDQVFAAMLVTSSVSIGLFLLTALAERLATPWQSALRARAGRRPRFPSGAAS